MKLFCLNVLTSDLKIKAYVEDYKEDSMVFKRHFSDQWTAAFQDVLQLHKGLV